MTLETLCELIDRDGLAILPRVFSESEADEINEQLGQALLKSPDAAESIRSRGGVYAARNVLRLFPPVRTLWQKPRLLELLGEILGPRFGLVRVLFFDKPPTQSWSLPWHQDKTIAVQRNDLPGQRFGKPTFKAGVPHVEAPRELLEQMLTLRIHLDEVTGDNGPLQVIPGSHHTDIVHPDDASSHGGVRQVLAGRGDVLAIRPLVSHSSAASAPGTARHRRVLHLEFCGQTELPDGYVWHDFETFA